MEKHYQDVTTVLADWHGGPLSQEAIARLRTLQAQTSDSHWKTMLGELGKRLGLKDKPADEQARVLRRMLHLNRLMNGRKSRRPVVKRDPAPRSCQNGWRQVAALGMGGFDFGSHDTPKIVPANPSQSSLGDEVNSVVEATFPALGQISLAAGVGEFRDSNMTSTQQFGTMLGSRAHAGLTKVFSTKPLGTIAQHALMVSCGVSFPNINWGFLPESKNPDELTWVCGQATLEVLTGFPSLAYSGQTPVQGAVETVTLFAAANIDGDFAVAYEEPGPASPVGLSATIPQPSPDSTCVYVVVAVALSAWIVPSTDAAAIVDGTGEATNLPLISYANPIEFGGDAEASSASGFQPINIVDLRACGI